MISKPPLFQQGPDQRLTAIYLAGLSMQGNYEGDSLIGMAMLATVGPTLALDVTICTALFDVTAARRRGKSQAKKYLPSSHPLGQGIARRRVTFSFWPSLPNPPSTPLSTAPRKVT